MYPIIILALQAVLTPEQASCIYFEMCSTILFACCYSTALKGELETEGGLEVCPVLDLKMHTIK